MAGPASGRKNRAAFLRAAFACLALTALSGTSAKAQTVTSDLFSPRRTTQMTPDNLAPRQISGSPSNTTLDPGATLDPGNDPNKRKADKPAESRIGKVPTYGLPAANGASDSGYDSLNR